MFTPPEPSTEVWQELPSIEVMIGHPAGRVWKSKALGLMVIRSLSEMTWPGAFIHVSVSRQDRLPNWRELSLIKDTFIGVDQDAYQVLAKKEDHVNIHSFCLHLFKPLSNATPIANLKMLRMERAI